MASIGSRELQEGIVGPLMDMMSSLSEQMRKNLSVEVSSINRRLDEVNNKVDYLISRKDGNNFMTKGNHTFVSEQPVLRKSSARTMFQLEEGAQESMSSESEGHRVVTGRSPTEYDRTPSKGRPVINKAHGQLSEDKYCTDSTGFSAQPMHNKEEDAGELSLEKRTESTLNDDTVPDIPIGKQLPEPHSEIKDYANEVEPEFKPEKMEMEDRVTDVSDTRENPAQMQSNKDMDSPAYPENSYKSLESRRSPLNAASPEHSFSRQRDGRRRRGLINFGSEDVHKRPQSPPPINESRHTVPYTNFKKTRTEFFQDNRTKFLKDAFNITEDGIDQHTSGKTGVDTNLPVKDMSKDQSQKDEELSKGSVDNEAAEEVIPARVTGSDQCQNFGDMSNNQQLALSGLKNEHGDEDNRFISAAHDEIPHASVVHRSIGLSNLKLVKNGPRRPLNGTDDVSSHTDQPPRRPEGGAKGGLQHLGSVPTKEDSESETLVTDDVLYSLIEKERLSARECGDMKSQGIDTVICLDTSSSMAGKPLTTAIDTICKILDGFETNAIYHELEENIALVTFGNENKIRCHLTNDYGVIREGVANITAGGPSPLWLGLALSLAEIKERGGACIMDPTTVLPRIILITDGFASRKNLLVGEDTSVVDDQVIREILSLMNQCSSFTSYMECITPGPYHEGILKSLTNGRMYTADDADHMIEFFRVQEKVNDIVKKVTSGEMDRDKVDEAIHSSKLSEKGKEDLKQIFSQSLSSMDQPNVESIYEDEGEHENKEQEAIPFSTSKEDRPAARPMSQEGGMQDKQPESLQDKQPESLQTTSLDSIDDVEAPPFGTAVVPNPEWIGFASRQNFTGTVIGIRRKGLVKILWSDGTAEKCRFGVNGLYDFLVSKVQDVDSSDLHIGSMVARGRDWRWKDQDGGEGSVGVVMKIEGPVVIVIWPHGGQGNYRYGYNKKFDLVLCKTRGNSTEEKHFAWYIEEEDLWKMFPSEVNESIEQKYKIKQNGTFLVKMDERALRISIQHFQARDPSTQTTYNIERRELSQDEWKIITNEQ